MKISYHIITVSIIDIDSTMATLIAPTNNSPQADAEALRKAFEGWGTDEKTIIAILGHRNTYQRQQIRRAYEEIFQEDLVKRLESEIKGDFEKAVYRWILEPADRDAVLANVALRSGKNYNVIVEISCILSPEELLAVRRAYLNRYKRSLEEDVAAHTSGHLRQASVFSINFFVVFQFQLNLSVNDIARLDNLDIKFHFMVMIHDRTL